MAISGSRTSRAPMASTCTSASPFRPRIWPLPRQWMNAPATSSTSRISHGTLQMRSHVMVDGSVGLKSLETILMVREEYRDIIDIQLVAFPQRGILKSPGTSELMDEAIAMGADLVGGLDPLSFDRDIKGHLDVVFGIAEKRRVDVDIHLHDVGHARRDDDRGNLRPHNSAWHAGACRRQPCLWRLAISPGGSEEDCRPDREKVASPS